MLLQFPTSVDAHLYSIGTLLCGESGRPHPDETMACQAVSNGFPEDARPLCELDGLVGAHDVAGLLTENAVHQGALCVRATRPFYDPSSNPTHCWMTISQVKIIGENEGRLAQENLFASSFVINTRLWERHAPDLIPTLNKAEFQQPANANESNPSCAIIAKTKLEPITSNDLELKDLPYGVGLILGALASGYPGQFGRESFVNVDEFLAALSYTMKLLPAALRHTISFAYGFAQRQPICALQYFDDREIIANAFGKPIAATPQGAQPNDLCQHIRGMLAERLKNSYAPEMNLNDYDEFEDDDDLFEEDGLFEELTGLARETSASLGQVLNEIGIQVRADQSALNPGISVIPDRINAFDCLLKGEDSGHHVTGLYTLFSDFDSAPHIYQQLLDEITFYFQPAITALAVNLGAAIRDEDFPIDAPCFLGQIEDLLCLAGRLPIAEPFLEYRSRIIEGAADALRQYVSARPFLSPKELIDLSEYEQVSDMVACILEMGDWSFTQRLNISFTIFALSGEGYIQDAAALARRLLPPSVVAHQWIHALINSRALAESFEAIINTPERLPGDQVITILQAMTDHLARTGRKDIVVEHVTRLGLSLPNQEVVNLTETACRQPLEEGLLLRLRMMTILSDAAERFHASAQHARLILSR